MFEALQCVPGVAQDRLAFEQPGLDELARDFGLTAISLGVVSKKISDALLATAAASCGFPDMYMMENAYVFFLTSSLRFSRTSSTASSNLVAGMTRP